MKSECRASGELSLEPADMLKRTRTEAFGVGHPVRYEKLASWSVVCQLVITNHKVDQVISRKGNSLSVS